MGYGVNILPLEKVIEMSKTLKEKAMERFIKKSSDPDLQEYRDYQSSLLYYLEELKKLK